MRLFIALFIFLFAFGSEEDFFFYGEHDFDVYHGPYDPTLVTNYRSGENIFLDEESERKYFYYLTTPDILEASEFFENFVAPSFNCSKAEYQESSAYLKYLYRLSAISLNYSMLRKIHISMYQVAEKESLCGISWEDIFKSCNPKSEDMKIFLKRSKQYFPDLIDWGNYPVFLNNPSFKKLSKKHSKNITLIDKYFADDNILSSFKQACGKIKSEIKSLCSEVDDNYGPLSDKKVQSLIISSSAFKLVNKHSKGEVCLQRFEGLHERFKPRGFIKDVYQRLTLEQDGLGELFWYGSLKEFDQQGVVLIEEQQEPAIIPVLIEKKEPVKVAVVKPKPKPKAVPKVVRRVEKKQVKKEVISTFKLAIRDYEKTRKPQIVDIRKMKNDYQYSKKTLVALNGPLKVYQTQKALRDMKKLDKFGAKGQPVSFLFLRYMIDHDLHQGLFNMMLVLGNEFYVKNDVEKESYPIKISLNNDRTTNFKWELKVLEVLK